MVLTALNIRSYPPNDSSYDVCWCINQYNRHLEKITSYSMTDLSIWHTIHWNLNKIMNYVKPKNFFNTLDGDCVPTSWKPYRKLEKYHKQIPYRCPFPHPSNTIKLIRGICCDWCYLLLGKGHRLFFHTLQFQWTMWLLNIHQNMKYKVSTF